MLEIIVLSRKIAFLNASLEHGAIIRVDNAYFCLGFV